MKCNSIFLVVFVQMHVACLSFYGAMSRISDHRHHWWDVLAGAIVGLVTAYHTVRFLGQIPNIIFSYTYLCTFSATFYAKINAQNLESLRKIPSK
jgi:membrane-associated phospholipid phosphatase